MDETETGPLLDPQNVRPNRSRPDAATNSSAKGITLCCLLLSFVLASFFLVITAAWRGVIQPACYIEKLHILPVHGTPNETQVISGTTVFFDLMFMDMYAWGKIYCDTVNMTFYYQGNNLSLPIGNILIPKFVIEKEALYFLQINHTFGLNWDGAAGIDVKNGTRKTFKITLDTKFKASSWYSDSPRSRIYRMLLQANVTVNDHGMSLEDQVWLSPALRSDLLSILQYIASAVILIAMLCLLCLCCCDRSPSRPRRPKYLRFLR